MDHLEYVEVVEHGEGAGGGGFQELILLEENESAAGFDVDGAEQAKETENLN